MAAAQARSATVLQFVIPGAILGAVPGYRQAGGGTFTLADRLALQSWGRRAGALGYGRVHMEPARPGLTPDSAAFVLVYCHNDPWSRWGLSRTDDGVMLWCSLTGRECGTHPTMDRALQALQAAS